MLCQSSSATSTANNAASSLRAVKSASTAAPWICSVAKMYFTRGSWKSTFGPLEWALRSFSYGERQQLRRHEIDNGPIDQRGVLELHEVTNVVENDNLGASG